MGDRFIRTAQYTAAMPKTVLPDARVSPRFAGIATFCRYPRLEDVAPENRPIDWALYGVPFDGGVTFRPGARFAPRAIREASQYVKRYSMAHDVDVCDALSLCDAGDAPVWPFDIQKTLDAVGEFAADLADRDTRLLAVGGDHSVAYANIRATYSRWNEPEGGLALIHFDAHLDTVDSVWGEKRSHASPFRRAIEEGFINPRRMLSIGARGPLNRGDDLDFARSAGVTLVTRDELLPGGPGVVVGSGGILSPGMQKVRAFLGALKDTPAYLTFDIDVVDPAFAPGTGTPSPGGLSSSEAVSLLRTLRGVQIVGADVVEVLPDRDVGGPAGITSMLASQVIFEVLSLDAARRANPT